jgi:mono/diheme cytochrome c family protein
MTMKIPPAGSVPAMIAAVAIAAVTAGNWSPDGASGRLLATSATRQPAAAAESARNLLNRYCVTCHNERRVAAIRTTGSALDAQLRETGLALDTVDAERPSADAALWERVIARLRAGSMPPAGRPRPAAEEARAVASWLESRIDEAASTNPNPGRTGSMHRLNRTEYGNAIRDLLALEVDVEALLPGDETSDTGFDNNAEVLSISTAQLERYLSAARKISRLATGVTTAPDFARFENSVLLTQADRQSEDLPLGSRGGLSATHYFPADGNYIFRIGLTSNWQDYVRGMGRRNLLDLRIDGRLVRRFTVGGEAPGTPAPTTWSPAEAGDPEWERYVRESAAHLEVRAPVDGGPHVVGVAFVRNLWEPEGPLQPVMKGAVLSNDEKYHGHAEVQSLTIEGPYEGAVPDDTPSRQRIFICRPSATLQEETCARRILSRLARLAYRRTPTDGDVETLLAFFRNGRAKEGGSFDTGIQLALERLLVDPDFLLRVHEDPPDAAPAETYALPDLELASRLSFFLWSSIPDEELLDAAERGELADPVIRRRQVRRMLADPRSEALVTNFAAQWLHLRNLDEVKAEPSVYPEFDQDLVDAFRQETALFIGSTIEQDRSVLDLLSADYTFVNERLARHYGIPGVYGSRFRRVTLPDLEQRGGLLGHGSLLSLTSYPHRTSPVLRGRWLLEAVFGAPPPGPPADVPPLPEAGENDAPSSMRERLELHRRNPACASCHRMIDPPGFMLEHYDAIGRWRSVTEAGEPVDAAGTLPNGMTAAGLSGLRSLLLDEPEQFVGTLTERLLAYALGRQPRHYDQPTVRSIVRGAAADGHRWSSIILGIVESPAFLQRRAAE